MSRAYHVSGGGGCDGDTNVCISILYDGWVKDDPFVAYVFGVGGFVLDSCEGKLGALDFSYEPKSMLVPIWASNTETNHLAVLSEEARTIRGTGPDDPRPGAGATPPLYASGWSVPETGRSAIAQRVFFSGKNPRTRLGRDPIEGGSS
jgi:hypothetical protein